MGIFSTKTKIYVSGGISKIREDKDIINTTGLVVSNASINNLDIADEIRLNELTGTKASYKSLWRSAKSSIGLPEGLISYRSPDKEALASYIRSKTYNSFPEADDIISTDSSQIVEELFIKYNLQSTNNYNYTTNSFVVSNVIYTFDSYTLVPNVKYIINGSRVTAVAPYVENISIDLMVVLPPLTESVLDPEGTFTYLNVPILYWHIIYEYLDREYIWIGKADEIVVAMSDETDAPRSLTKYFKSFAPVIATRNNFNDYTTTNEPEEYKKSKKLLKLIGLDIDDLNKAVNTGEGGGTNPEIANICDTYVTLQSKLVSTHMDELAYNYLFFDKLSLIDNPISLIPPIDIEDGAFIQFASPYNVLTVHETNIFKQRIYWRNTTKATFSNSITDPMHEEYTCALINEGYDIFEDYSYGKYTIKKRLTKNTYDEFGNVITYGTHSKLEITGLGLEYYVFYDSDNNSAKSFSPEFTSTDPDALTQLTIPVSLSIAKEALGNDLETFFLRTTYIGIFSRFVVKVKWYEQTFFRGLILAIAVFIAVTTAVDAMTFALESTVQAVGLITGIGASTYVIAALILIGKYVVASLILKKLLTETLGSTDNQFLQALAIVAFIYVSYQMVDTSNFSTLQSVNTALGSVNTALSVKAEVMEEELEDIAEEVQLVTKTYEETLKEFKLTDNDKASELKSRYIAYLNLMSRSGVVYDEIETDLAVQSYDATVSYASTFVRSALNIDRESFAALFTSTEQLVDNEPIDPIVT
jgi:hypothetical protein